MEIKKSPKADLQRMRSVFFETGLAVVLVILLVAFEWNSGDTETEAFGPLVVEQMESEEIPITRADEPEPPKEVEQPKPQQIMDQIVIADDDTEVKEEVEFASSEASEDTQVEVAPIEEEEETAKEDEIFVKVEQMPVFPGGDLALRKFLAENVDYPEAARENEISGRVYVEFVVNEQGKVTNVKVVRGVNPVLDKEAVKVVQKLPNFSPGYQGNKPAKVKFTVPINFVLSK